MSEQRGRPATTKKESQKEIAPREDDYRDEANVAAELTNAGLRQLAIEHRPPAEWFAGGEEDLF